jgi:hypothetical protein
MPVEPWLRAVEEDRLLAGGGMRGAGVAARGDETSTIRSLPAPRLQSSQRTCAGIS